MEQLSRWCRADGREDRCQLKGTGPILEAKRDIPGMGLLAGGKRVLDLLSTREYQWGGDTHRCGIMWEQSPGENLAKGGRIPNHGPDLKVFCGRRWDVLSPDGAVQESEEGPPRLEGIRQPQAFNQVT